MNISKYVGSKIKEFRNKNNMNQDELAELLGTTKQTVSRYENGERQANQDVLFQLAEIFRVSIDDLFPPTKSDGLTRESSASYGVERLYSYIPASISAGAPIEVDGIESTKEIRIPDIVLGKWAGQDIFITRINGESMNKVIPDGSLIAVKSVGLNNLKNGDIVVFSHDHEYSVKRFYHYDDVLVFRPDSDDIRFSELRISKDAVESLQIHGKVVLYIVELDK